MKNMLVILITVCCLFNLSGVKAQDFAGVYKTEFNTKNAEIQYTLELTADGRFSFHQFEDHQCDSCEVKNKYAKGRWVADDLAIIFYTDREDLDEKFTLDFTNSGARYLTKSARDRSDRVVRTRLQFFKSDIFYLKGVEFFKQ